ncbi:MAG: hypothetical protein ATN32_01045 [Candidatus Epulonipiscium fishelsonii]|nr:MAG: hypothetical protein ATN32_01045 [Epulopiscium sp. AS2M-Bin002]
MTKTTSTKTLVKTLDILLSFDSICTHQKTSEIARKLNLNISTVSRHLTDLVSYGFLEQDIESGYYYLGSKVIGLAGVALNSSALYKIAYQEVYQLSKKMNLYASMSILKDTNIMHLFDVFTEDTFNLLIPIGYERALASCAMGRIILANLPDSLACSIVSKTKVAKLTPYSINTASEIMEQIFTAKRTSYSILVDEIKIGTSSIATAIYDKNAKVIGAISVSAETNKLNDKYKDEVVNNLLIAANNISAKLGYFPR